MDKLILLERKNPTVYEIHRNKIEQAKNIILSTSDKDLATRIVLAYNNFPEVLSLKDCTGII